jgi:hypothetical protein
MQPSCPGSRDLNWTGKGLTTLIHEMDYKMCMEELQKKINIFL